jgi:hypothetical protein
MELKEWILYGDKGVSSETMWAALMDYDIKSTHGDKPYDTDDFSRCYKLVKICYLKYPELHLVSEKLPYWKPYIDNWQKLSEMLEKNTPNMYEYMKELRLLSDEIRQQWS